MDKAMTELSASVEEVRDAFTTNLKPYMHNLRTLPEILEAFTAKMAAMVKWQEQQGEALRLKLKTKAEQSAVGPIQKALVLMRWAPTCLPPHHHPSRNVRDVATRGWGGTFRMRLSR